jgi:hypothetical protein
MTDEDDDRLMQEKTVEWLQAEALKLCRLQLGCHHLEAVLIGPTKPKGSGPNWELLAFKPELHPHAHDAAMRVIHMMRGVYALAKRRQR